jgi:hypothetical protein
LAHRPRKGPPETAACRGSPEANLPEIIFIAATSKLKFHSREQGGEHW